MQAFMSTCQSLTDVALLGSANISAMMNNMTSQTQWPSNVNTASSAQELSPDTRNVVSRKLLEQRNDGRVPLGNFHQGLVISNLQFAIRTPSGPIRSGTRSFDIHSIGTSTRVTFSSIFPVLGIYSSRLFIPATVALPVAVHPSFLRK